LQRKNEEWRMKKQDRSVHTALRLRTAFRRHFPAAIGFDALRSFA
jgi:hypothetical protein